MNERAAASPAISRLETWLDQFLNFERLPKKDIFWLDTIVWFCERAGHPERASQCFHVAGSKGKGSVSAMISSILEEAGHPCGLYTSPHITDVRERVSRAGTFFPEAVYEAAFQKLVDTVETAPTDEIPGGRDITWFELMTLFAFLCYQEAGVPWVVYETGLGGRLDATNVVRPRSTVFTPIELEHTEFLGDTLEKIAGEKAGIIKTGVPVCVGFQHTGGEAVMAVFEETARKQGAPLYRLDEELVSMSVGKPCMSGGGLDGADDCAAPQGSAYEAIQHVELVFKRFFSRPLSFNLRLLGRVQAENAALAALSVKLVFPELAESVIERGLEKAALPGRFEIVANPYAESGVAAGSATLRDAAHIANAVVVLDGAHTKNSVENTVGTLNALIGTEAQTSADCAGTSASRAGVVPFACAGTGSTTVSPPHLLFACARDKDTVALVNVFLPDTPLFSRITLTRPGDLKQSDLPFLEAACRARLATLQSTAASGFTSASPSAGAGTVSAAAGSKSAQAPCPTLAVNADYRAAIMDALKAAAQDRAALLVTGSFYLVAEIKKVLAEIESA